jgi:hypothetical protein
VVTPDVSDGSGSVLEQLLQSELVGNPIDPGSSLTDTTSTGAASSDVILDAASTALTSTTLELNQHSTQHLTGTPPASSLAGPLPVPASGTGGTGTGSSGSGGSAGSSAGILASIGLGSETGQRCVQYLTSDRLPSSLTQTVPVPPG